MAKENCGKKNDAAAGKVLEVNYQDVKFPDLLLSWNGRVVKASDLNLASSNITWCFTA